MQANNNNRYISYLDGLRGYAIFFVLLGHFNLVKITLAQVGVTIFFFISGFLITKLLIYEYTKGQTIGLREFYIRRVLRLYPALLFMLLCYCTVLLVFGYRIIGNDILAGLFYYTNYYLTYFHPVLPDAKYLLVSEVLWSLSVEEHFYLLFPLLFLWLLPRGKLFIKVLVLLLAAFLVVRILTVAYASGNTFFINYYTTHCRADSILYGCVAALLVFHYQSKWYVRVLQSGSCFYIGLVVLVASVLFRNVFFQKTFVYSLEGVGLFLMIPSISFARLNGIMHKIIDNKISVYIGKLSYSLYLCHWVAMQLGILYFPKSSPGWFAVVVPTTVILALVSFYLVEKPFLALRKKFGSNVRVGVAG